MRNPWAALAGFVLGHQFDRGFAKRFRVFEKQGSHMPRVSEDFVRALFQAMGHLVKIDGRVSEDEIRSARMVMHRLSLNPAQVRRAIAWFDEGKQPGFPLIQRMREVRRVSARSASDRLTFVRLLLEVVLAKESLKKEERALIWKICVELDIGRVEFAQLEAMIRAQKGFKRSPAGDADASRVRRATPPSELPDGDGRMKASGRRESSSMRVLSPRMLPPVTGLVGSTASTATL